MWIKNGRIFHLEPAPNRSCHAQVPTPWVMEDRVRVYYACRNNGQAYVAYFDLAFDLKTIIAHHETPVFEKGRPGMFDADGVMPSSLIKNGDDLWMYYIGWNELSGKHARYQNEIGIAVSKDGGNTFERLFDGPVIGRTPLEPGLAVMPFVMYKNWLRIWYQSLTEWVKVGERYEPVYVIKHAKSIDGVNWTRPPEQCIESEHPMEAFSRPSVYFDENISVYNMWFCHRGSNDYRGGVGSYNISHAYSSDGIKFIRSGLAFPYGERGEWDSEMLCYPYVFEVGGKLVMLYNGNDFGQTGVGVAVWENIH